MHNYHDMFQAFPTVSRTPTAAHSVFTRVLPFIEQEDLFRHYDTKVDWFNSRNRTAIQTRVDTYECPSAATNQLINTAGVFLPGTDYSSVLRVDTPPIALGLVDQETAKAIHAALEQNWHLSKISDITDGTSTSILMVEVAGRPGVWRLGKPQPGVYTRGAWADPWEFIDIDGANRTTGALGGPCAINCTNAWETFGFHPAGASVLFCRRPRPIASRKYSAALVCCERTRVHIG